MKEELKLINECVLYKDDKEERLKKLNNLRKVLYSEFECGYMSANLFDLIDEISIMIIAKTKYEVGDSFSTHQRSKQQESEIIAKFDELRNPLLNVLIELSKIEFVAE